MVFIRSDRVISMVTGLRGSGHLLAFVCEVIAEISFFRTVIGGGCLRRMPPSEAEYTDPTLSIQSNPRKEQPTYRGVWHPVL